MESSVGNNVMFYERYESDADPLSVRPSRVGNPHDTLAYTAVYRLTLSIKQNLK